MQWHDKRPAHHEWSHGLRWQEQFICVFLQLRLFEFGCHAFVADSVSLMGEIWLPPSYTQILFYEVSKFTITALTQQPLQCVSDRSILSCAWVHNKIDHKNPLCVCVCERERERERKREREREREKDRVGETESERGFCLISIFSRGGTWGLSLTKDIWRRSAVEESREGRRAVECDGSRLARLWPQTEQLKRWHQPVGTLSSGVKSWMREGGAGVSSAT